MTMDKRLSSIEADIKVIKAAILGHEGNADEGIIAISRKNEREIADLRSTLRTVWAAVVAIPIIAMAVTFFVPDASSVRELPHR